MKSLDQEMLDNLKATNDYSSSKVHDSDSCNDHELVNETVPHVCRTMSTRIAYLQHRHKTTNAKKATDKLRRDEMPSSNEVRVSVTTACSPVANDPVRSAEPSARSRVASDSVRSVDNAVLKPHAPVYRLQASDVVRSAVTSDVTDKSNATDVVRSAVTSMFLISPMRPL